MVRLKNWGEVPPSKDEIDAILEKFGDLIRDEIETWAATRTPYAEAQVFDDEEDFIERGGDLLVERHFAPASQQQLWEMMLECADLSEAAARLKPLLAERGYETDESAVAFKKLAYRATQTGITIFRQAKGTVFSGIEDGLPGSGQGAAQSDRPTPYVPTVASIFVDGPTLAEAFKGYIAEKLRANWGSKSGRDADTTMRLAIDYFGADRPAATVSRKEAKAFRTALGSMPKLHGKGRFAGLGLHDAIAAADAIDEVIEDRGLPEEDASWPGLSEEGRVARLALKTANKHLTYMLGVFNHLMEDDTGLQTNPFSKLLYSKTAIAKKANEQRLAWEDDEVRELLATPIWAGCLTGNRRSVPGKLILKDAEYWAPLIALHAGLRLEEVCQLAPDDIEEIQGVICFHIRRGDGRIVKTESSIRQVPVHPRLVRLGLLDHASAAKKAGYRQLFPELERGGPFKLLGYQLSKRFTAYRRSVGMYEVGKDFHSFRHSFDTHLQRKKVRSEIVGALLGHAAVGETNARYFKGYELSQLVEAINTLDYGIEGLLFEKYT